MVKLMNMNNPEDQKLVTLAQATLARTGAAQAAALRDTTGRTYVGVNINSPELVLDAIEAVFVIAQASQISGIESVVYVGSAQAKTSVITSNSPTSAIFYIDLAGHLTSI